MISKSVKLVLLSCLIFQAGCDITFKRKSMGKKMAPVAMSENTASSEMDQNAPEQIVKHFSKYEFRDNDLDIITSFFREPENANIRKDVISTTALTKHQQANLVIGKLIPRTVQIVPLPLKLEKILSLLPLHIIRVQVGARVILMDVKSRLILNMIKI